MGGVLLGANKMSSSLSRKDDSSLLHVKLSQIEYKILSRSFFIFIKLLQSCRCQTGNGTSEPKSTATQIALTQVETFQAIAPKQEVDLLSGSHKSMRKVWWNKFGWSTMTSNSGSERS